MRRRLPLWTLLLAVLVAALVVGSGALSSAPPTNAERAAAIESVIRCPSCEDLTVADSTAQTAQSVRATVRTLVDEGRSDAAIQRYLVDRYGSAIVLDPPARGLTALVWVLPVVAGAVAVAALVVVAVRRRTVEGAAGRAGTATPGDAAGLEDRRRFLARSLDDADAEYLAGDLSDRDYLALRQRDLARLAAVDARLAQRAAPAATAPDPAAVAVAPDPAAVAVAVAERAEPRAGPADAVAAPAPGVRAPRSRRRRWFLGGAVACFVAALVVVVVAATAGRQPGQSVTGSDALSAAQRVEAQLDQAASLEDQGQLVKATADYRSVLAAHPDNEVALAQLGWLEFQAGQAGDDRPLLADARAKLRRAVALDGSDPAARLYLGTVLLEQDDDVAGAVAQYRRFLADHPAPEVVEEAAPELRTAFQQAGLPLPAGVPSA